MRTDGRSWAGMPPSCSGSNRNTAGAGLVVIAVIAIVVAVPVMVMLAASTVPFPIAVKKAGAVMMRPYPARANVGRASPVSVMPPIAVAGSIPVSVYPNIVGAGTRRVYANNPRRWRRPDSDSDGDLGAAD